jgi:hypothetical protein
MGANEYIDHVRLYDAEFSHQVADWDFFLWKDARCSQNCLSELVPNTRETMVRDKCSIQRCVRRCDCFFLIFMVGVESENNSQKI